MDITANGSVLTLSVPLLAGLAAGYLLYRLFLATLPAVRRSMHAVRTDTSFRVAALSRLLGTARAETEVEHAHRARLEEQVVVLGESLAAARGATLATQEELRLVRTALRTTDAANLELRGLLAQARRAVPAPSAAPAERPAPAGRGLDRPEVIRDVFSRLIPRLVHDEEQDARRAITDLQRTRTAHLARFALPYEEIPVMVEHLDPGRVADVCAQLDRLALHATQRVVRETVDDPGADLDTLTTALRGLGVLHGIDPDLEGAAVLLVRRYTPRELRLLARRLAESAALLHAPTSIEVATPGSADLVARLWREIAGTAPVTISQRPDLVGGLVITHDLAVLDASWSQTAPRIDENDLREDAS